MAAEDLAAKAVAQRGVGDALQGAGFRVAALVDVQVEVEAVGACRLHEPVEGCVGARVWRSTRKGDAAEDAPMASRDRDDGAELVGPVEHRIERKQRDALKRDAVGVGRAHFGEDRPGDRRLLASRVEMRADRAGAVGEGAADCEAHAGAHVLGRPAFLPVDAGVFQRAREGAVRVRAAWPDVALIKVGVEVDEAGQEKAAVDVKGWKLRVEGEGARGDDGGDAAVRDRDVDRGEPVAAGGEVGRGRERQRHAGVGEPVGGCVRDRGGPVGHAGSAHGTLIDAPPPVRSRASVAAAGARAPKVRGR
jgi:hypothetical protein